MHIPATAKDNLQFLVTEVSAQCLTLSRALNRADTALLQRVLDRAGYAANLKGRVQGSCIQAIAETPGTDHRRRLQLAALSDIAHQLDRVTDKFRDLGTQFLEAENRECLNARRFKTPLTRVRETLSVLAGQLPRIDGDAAMAFSRCAQKVDRQANRLHSDYVDAISQHPEQAPDLTRGVLMANALRQVGDASLRISEALLSLQIGQPMRFDRFQSLQTFIEERPELEGVGVADLAGTRSGNTVAGLLAKNNTLPAAVMKNGLLQKLRRERKGVESWHEVFPGLAPRILDYHRRGESASLLIEHLPGMTFEQILLSDSEPLLEAASRALARTLRDVWRATRSDAPVAANFMDQIQARLPDIKAAHPQLLRSSVRIGHYRPDTFEQLVRRAAKAEKKIPPTFSVYVHGDFNVDNIIYDPDGDRIHFIDLHRSRYMDYLQDVSVFMVSCFRLPARNRGFSDRVFDTLERMDRSARRFARTQQDRHYDFRLALGLARSFATSSRFIADTSIAAGFLGRARYLMERVTEVKPRHADHFHLPLKELFHDHR